MGAAARTQTPREVTSASLKRGQGRKLYATMTVYRGPAHASETLEVDLEGVPVPPDSSVGLYGWDVEDFRARFQGADFTLTQQEQEQERAVSLLLGN